MTLRLIALGFALVAVCPPALALVEATDGGHASAKGTRLTPSTLSLSVGADGTPASVACKPEVAQTLCPILVRAVSGWKFSPGQRAGVPTAMNIELTLDMVAVSKPGGFGVQATSSAIRLVAPLAESAIAPGPRQLNPPRYPVDDVRNGRSGVALLELWVQPDTDLPRIGRTWFDGEPSDKRNSMVFAAMKAASKWSIDRGIAEQQSICVPVEFRLEIRKRPNSRVRDPEPCKPTYAAGFAPPTLITKVESAVF